MFYGALLVAWTIRSLFHSLWSPTRNVGMTVSGLLAGIVLVDLLAVAGGFGLLVAFVLLFAGALLFQRVIPAT
jgi:hypothetical protein